MSWITSQPKVQRRVRRRLNCVGFTQEQAAAFLGIESVRTIQNWEIASTRPAGGFADMLLAIMEPKKERK